MIGVDGEMLCVHQTIFKLIAAAKRCATAI